MISKLNEYNKNSNDFYNNSNITNLINTNSILN